MSKDKIKIIEKIKKLLRLADDKRGGTPAEVAAAAAKAQEIMLEHNLTMAHVGDIGEERGDDIGHQFMKLNATYLTSRWHSALLYNIAKPLFCRMIYHPARAGQAGAVSLIGTPSNVEIVKYFYEFLYQTIECMAVEYRDEWKAKMDKKGEKYIPDDSFRVRVDFCLGAVGTIGRRMREMYEEKTEQNADTRAVVVRNDQALEEAFKKAFPKTATLKTSRMTDLSARSAGAKAGENIPLNKGVGRRAATRQMIG